MDALNEKRSPRVKRTYNLSRTSVETVKRLVEEYHLATSQGAVVERAIRDLDRRARDARDAALWSQAAEDAEFVGELQEIEAGFAAADQRSWQL